MATIHNSDLSRNLIDGAKIQVNRDNVPNRLADSVVPTMEVNPALLRVCNVGASGTATNSTSNTMYTTPVDKDFYLCGASLSTIKDVTSTSTFSAIAATPAEGTSIAVLSISSLSLTPQTLATSAAFIPPIRLTRGTGIQVTNTTNVANITSKGSIWGYTVDNIRA